MVPRWRFLATFLRPVFSASRVQHASDLHLKFTLRPCREQIEREREGYCPCNNDIRLHRDPIKVTPKFKYIEIQDNSTKTYVVLTTLIAIYLTKLYASFNKIQLSF